MNKKREIIITKDGSKSIYLPEPDETYHSRNGALKESVHVFIQAGLCHRIYRRAEEMLHILEVGFGTGLNALLTMNKAVERQIRVHYTCLEPFPLPVKVVKALEYDKLFSGTPAAEYVSLLHEIEWEKPVPVIEGVFSIEKIRKKTDDFAPSHPFDVIYYDAFSPRVQPGLWTDEIFQKIYTWTAPEGVWVTYSAKGSVRRALEKAGYRTERLPGPPGKREMLRGIRIEQTG